MTAVGTPPLPPRLAGDPSSVRGAARAPRPDDADPASGRVITADGEQLSIGSTNGAQRVFGQDSWQWLLLGPLSR